VLIGLYCMHLRPVDCQQREAAQVRVVRARGAGEQRVHLLGAEVALGGGEEGAVVQATPHLARGRGREGKRVMSG
jgi:hypothetical protein